MIEKVSQLGYGTGPWSRDQLVALWGGPGADKFIRDAKAHGWLVSPGRGVYSVPTASDLMVVGWLSPTLRQEYLISRTLAASGLRFWCLSAWAREQDVDLGGPVFVTDLAAFDGVDPSHDTPGDARTALLERVGARTTLPCTDALLIVPHMPPTQPPQGRAFIVPESDDAQQRKQMGRAVTAGVAGLVALGTRLVTKEWRGIEEIGGLLEDHDEERTIPYTLGPEVADRDWTVALLAALGIARAEELAFKIAKKQEISSRRVAAAAALLGPPQPNTEWRHAVEDGPFPFLLVPPVLWQQMGADQAARRAKSLDRLVRAAHA